MKIFTEILTNNINQSLLFKRANSTKVTGQKSWERLSFFIKFTQT
jgi:hypothetical protein